MNFTVATIVHFGTLVDSFYSIKRIENFSMRSVSLELRIRGITKKASIAPIVGGKLQATEFLQHIPIQLGQKTDLANNQ